jgi:hypothetical protein
MFVSTDGTLLIDTCYLTGSSASDGGALTLATADNVDKPIQFNVTRSVFDDNRASEMGNAIYVTSGVLSLSHCIVRNHVYTQQEAIMIAAASAYILDSLFHDNSGGAVSTFGLDDLQLIVERSNFTNNDALDASPAIQAQEASLYLSEVSTNTVWRTYAKHTTM